MGNFRETEEFLRRRLETRQANFRSDAGTFVSSLRNMRVSRERIEHALEAAEQKQKETLEAQLAKSPVKQLEEVLTALPTNDLESRTIAEIVDQSQKTVSGWITAIDQGKQYLLDEFGVNAPSIRSFLLLIDDIHHNDDPLPFYTKVKLHHTLPDDAVYRREYLSGGGLVSRREFYVPLSSLLYPSRLERPSDAFIQKTVDTIGVAKDHRSLELYDTGLHTTQIPGIYFGDRSEIGGRPSRGSVDDKFFAIGVDALETIAA